MTKLISVPIMALILIGLLSACQPQGPSALAVSQSFWRHVENSELELANALVLKEDMPITTREYLQGVRFEFGETFISINEGGTNSAAKSIVKTKMVSAQNKYLDQVEFDTVLVKENQKWVVDFGQSMMSMQQHTLVRIMAEMGGIRDKLASQMNTVEGEQALEALMLETMKWQQGVGEGLQELAEALKANLSRTREELRKSMTKVREEVAKGLKQLADEINP